MLGFSLVCDEVRELRFLDSRNVLIRSECAVIRLGQLVINL